jgi:hypothetical protein
LPAWHVGQLQLLLGEPEAAVASLRAAVGRADELGVGWMRPLTRVDLARALHRLDKAAEASAVLSEGEELAERYGMAIAVAPLARARAELEGRPLEPAVRAQGRARPIRALAARSGRRALATMARGLDDAELESRFADPRRQRSLLRAMLRGFQPAQAAGFEGIVAYELEPLAIAPPADAPWRWAMAIDSRAGHAQLVEPAPLDAAATVHFGLADWVRVTAGIENPLAAMFSGRCRVEGDVEVAMRLEPMFSGS